MPVRIATDDLDIRVVVNDGVVQLFLRLSGEWTWIDQWSLPVNDGQAWITLICEGAGFDRPVVGSFSYLRVY